MSEQSLKLGQNNLSACLPGSVFATHCCLMLTQVRQVPTHSRCAVYHPSTAYDPSFTRASGSTSPRCFPHGYGTPSQLREPRCHWDLPFREHAVSHRWNLEAVPAVLCKRHPKRMPGSTPRVGARCSWEAAYTKPSTAYTLQALSSQPVHPKPQ